MKNKLLFVLLLFCGVFFSSLVQWASWSFPGLSIVSRADWWATESWRYFSETWYKSWVERTKRYTDRLAGSGEDTTGDFEKRKKNEEINDAREAFLAKSYPEELVVDTTIREVDGKRLLRWLWYHRAKTKIVLHHTVTRQVVDMNDAKASLQEIYKQHTITQWRGDIGYNFLLDPVGNIYEGRYGGKDIIGAHADRNNTRTVGVALLGNYDVHEPTAPMRRSLKKLLLWIALEYGIDPFQKQTYFTPTQEEPWLVASTHTSLVGHSDTKNTACPGVHVENRLPELRNEINNFLKTLQWWKKSSLQQFSFLTKKLSIWMHEDRAVGVYSFPNRIVRDCKLFGEGISLKQCGGDGKNLIVTINRETKTPSGQYALLVDTDRWAVWIDVVVVWQEQLDLLLKNRQETNPLLEKPIKTLEKQEIKVWLPMARELLARTMGVLLYEPTTVLDHREMQCESWCAVLLDDKRFTDVRLVRAQQMSWNENKLTVFLDLKKYEASSLRLINPRSVITFTNRSRWSTDYPLNYFRGDIHIQREKYTTVDKKEKTWWVVVNHLPVAHYLQWIAETIETQHTEKLTVMSLLVKGYTLFYLWGNIHPSVPVWSSYQAIDDPRLFQKYVWAGIEQTTPRRQQALQKTANELVVYDTYLPILPYFHCSAGFIRSWAERFGRSDTPWLVSKLDLATCESGTFEWHGVGLSGDWAEKLAQKGTSYKDIIGYYYPWVRIATY